MGKLGGRGGGGGRGAGKRSLPPPPPPSHIQRVGPSAAAARLPVGPAASRGLHGVAAVTGGPAAAVSEETFSMVSADMLDFAAIIRLTPDLVDEIRRLEAQGGGAKIKFNSNSNDLSGNVIDVGGKEFKFTWSRELGVCDIYEELQNGEDGDGLLSECGSAWRKLNVQRILDESLKNQVKMRSEEAERRLKSRKSIILDPANPSVKNQAKTMAAAAVEGNMRRMHWKKDQAFKKRKSEPGIVPSTIAPRSAFKSGFPSNTPSATLLSISPQSSPPEQAGGGASVSPFGMANLPKGPASVEEDHAPLTSNAEDVINAEKELSNKPTHGATRRLVVNKGASSSQPADLRGLLVNLLLVNPKGMSLKALEKAVGEVIPNSAKKIESIIKTIATYQAPGRYILKPKAGVESSRRPPSENGSSPEHPLASLPVTKVLEKDNIEDSEHKTLSTPKPLESDIIERIDIEQKSFDQPTTEMKVDIEKEGAGSSSESGSDSDSESDSSDSGSDSGSQSRSRSKSQSPMGSGSASSSDSESDGSSSSKEGSDVDVDIMTSDDDKEETENKLPTSPKLSLSPREMKVYDEKHEDCVIGRGTLDFKRASPPIESHDFERGDVVCADEDTKGRFKESRVKTYENYETATTGSIVSDDFQMDAQCLGERTASQDQHQQRVLQSVSSAGNSRVDKHEHVVSHSSVDKQCTKGCADPKQSDCMETIPKAKSKRPSDSKHFREKPESNKRHRAANAGVQVSSGKTRDISFPKKSHLLSPERSECRAQIMMMPNDIEQDRNTFDSQKEPDNARAGRYLVNENVDRPKLNPDLQNVNVTSVDAQQLGHRVGDTTVRKKAFDCVEKSGRHVDSSRASRHPEKSHGHADETDPSGTKSLSLHDKFSMSKDKLHKDVRDVSMDVNEKYLAKNHIDDTGVDKTSSFPDSHYKRSSDQYGIQRETKLSLNMHIADVDKCGVTGEKGVPLRREPSELELGEFREPLANEDTKDGRKQIERKGSFRSSDSKLNVMDNFSSDSNKGRTPAKAVHDESKRESSSMSKCGSQANQDGSNRRMSEGDIMESTVPQLQTIPLQVQQFPRTDRTEHDSLYHLDRLSDMAGRSETKTSQGVSQGSHVASHQRTSTNVLPYHDTKRNGQITCKPAIGSKPHKYHGLNNTSDRSKESFQVESVTSSGKRMDSSSDEDNPFYAKYDKNEPELRGPIKDFSQYKEYVQEYHEKYACYSSLDRHLEKYRNAFSKVGCDLEFYKGRDKESYLGIAEQIMQMYHQHRKKHSQMKKTFIILHDELKILKQRIIEFAEEFTKD